MQQSRKWSVGVIAGMLAASMVASACLADGSAALKSAPHGANAVLTIDVAKLIQSPLGKTAELQSKLTKGYADRPLAVPATASNVTMVAGVHPMGMESMWQVAIVELLGKPRLDAIVTAQGGFGDTIAGKPAGWSRHDIYYVQLDEHSFGVVRPAQRQFVNRWLAAKDDAPPSPYLSSALAAGSDATAVFAVDLDGAVASPATRFAFAMGELPSLEEMDPATQSKLLDALSSVKGMKITIKAADTLNAEWVIDFGQDISALGAQAKPFIADVMTAAGMNDGNIDKWDFKVAQKQITGTASMDLSGLSRLIALLSPGAVDGGDAADVAAVAKAPAAGQPTAAQPTAGQPAAAQPAADPATASLNYYRAIAKSLDGIEQKISPTQGAVWLSGQARVIERLPLLNVDPALLAWGNQVAETYRRAGQELAVGQMSAQNAALGVAVPVSYRSYNDNGYGVGSTAESRAAFKNAQQQRRQLSQTERAAAAGRALAFFNDITPLRGKVRAEMTQKYGVEF